MQNTKNIKVNLCCGMDYREGYLNVDFTNVGSDGNPIKIDLNHDVLTGLPWENDSIEEIVFRESLEHFNREQGVFILKEIYRVLKQDGKLDLSVPNAPRQLKILISQIGRSVSYEQWMNPHGSPWGYGKYHEDLMGATHFDSKGDSHLTLYTATVLDCVLKHIGFKIEHIKPDSSFYVTARK